MAGLRERLALWRVRRWVTDRAVDRPEPLREVHLRAVLCTWHEADIIAVTVGNAFEQGCEAVHLLDNGSRDETVARGVAAGATPEDVFSTEGWPQDERIERISAVVERVSRETGLDHLWWLYIDADELVEGPDGTRVADFLRSLHRSFRVVGSRTINHYPDRNAPMEPGADPRRSPSLAHERSGAACRLGHWKHPLVRWDAAGPPLQASGGFHIIDADRRLVEPRQAIISHHYPYRNRAVTQARLERLGPRLVGHKWAMSRRLANLDAVYRQAYDDVDGFDMVGPGQRLEPRPWPPVRGAPS